MRSIVLALALVASPAFAGKCITNDAWTGPDKTKHLAVGLAMGSSVTLLTKSPERAVLVATAVAAAKEVVDSRSAGHTCSLQDFAVTVAGGVAGAYGTAWVILPKKDGVQVAYAKRF